MPGRDNWEIRLRGRKRHEELARLTPNEIVDAEFNWRMTTMASGRLQVAATVIDPDLLDEMAYPSEAIGGVDVEFYREHELGTDQFLGVVSSLNFLRGATDNISSLNVGSVVNRVCVLGAHPAPDQPRLIVAVEDAELIKVRGLHEGLPYDAREQTTLAALRAVGNVELDRHLHRLRVDETVDFRNTSRIDRIDIYLDDPFVYFDRRYSTPGAAEARSYGGVSASEYIANLYAAEVRGAAPHLALDAQAEWERSTIGAAFDVAYPRTRLLRILEQAVIAGGLCLRYRLHPDTDQLTFSVDRGRDRRVEEDRVVLAEGAAIDQNGIYPGDRVERTLRIGERAVGGAQRARLSSRLDLDSSVVVRQRQIRIGARRGLEVRLSTGDITVEQTDVARRIADLSNTARLA